MKVTFELDLTTQQGVAALKILANSFPGSATVTVNEKAAQTTATPATVPAVKTVPAAVPATVVPKTVPAAVPATPAPAATEADPKDAIRLLVQDKIANGGHAGTIKNWLTQNGFKNVSSVTEDKYDEFNEFLKGL